MTLNSEHHRSSIGGDVLRARVPNVSATERVLSALAGGALIAGAIKSSRGLARLGLAAAGGALVYRGLSGHCGLYQALGWNTAEDRSSSGAHSADELVEEDLVAVASADSFPASDPPAWTATSATRDSASE